MNSLITIKYILIIVVSGSASSTPLAYIAATRPEMQKEIKPAIASNTPDTLAISTTICAGFLQSGEAHEVIRRSDGKFQLVINFDNDAIMAFIDAINPIIAFIIVPLVIFGVDVNTIASLISFLAILALIQSKRLLRV